MECSVLARAAAYCRTPSAVVSASCHLPGSTCLKAHLGKHCRVALELGHDGGTGRHGVQIANLGGLVKVLDHALLNVIAIRFQLPHRSFDAALQPDASMIRCSTISSTASPAHFSTLSREVWVQWPASASPPYSLPAEQADTACMSVDEAMPADSMIRAGRPRQIGACHGVWAVCGRLNATQGCMLTAAQHVLPYFQQLTTHGLHIAAAP